MRQLITRSMKLMNFRMFFKINEYKDKDANVVLTPQNDAKYKFSLTQDTVRKDRIN